MRAFPLALLMVAPFVVAPPAGATHDGCPLQLPMQFGLRTEPEGQFRWIRMSGDTSSAETLVISSTQVMDFAIFDEANNFVVASQSFFSGVDWFPTGGHSNRFCMYVYVHPNAGPTNSAAVFWYWA